jgi:quercetin dioxygenase-like cupin family protein
MGGAGASGTGSGVPLRVLIGGEETDGSLAVIELCVGRDAPSPCHTHAREDEIVYVLDGHLTFNLGGHCVEVAAGGCIRLPRNVEHSYRVVSDEARLLVIVTPAGLEGFFRELGAPGALPVEHLVCTAARYGVAITGPAV